MPSVMLSLRSIFSPRNDPSDDLFIGEKMLRKLSMTDGMTGG